MIGNIIFLEHRLVYVTSYNSYALSTAIPYRSNEHKVGQYSTVFYSRKIKEFLDA